MGLGVATVQSLLELHRLDYFKNSNSVMEIGAQELHLKKEDLKELFEVAGLESELVEKFPRVDNWPNRPRTSSKYLYESLGLKEYQSIDINGEMGAIAHDLNKPFTDKSKFNKFDIVTDYGACEHVFNIAEAYRTMHNLTKPGGYIIVSQQVIGGNGYFKFDESFFEGIASANNYKIIYNNYIVQTLEQTKNGSDHQFLISRNKKMFSVLDLSYIMKTEGVDLGVYGVLQKTKEDEFKIPYQNQLMKEMYDIRGFNRVYLKEPMGANLYVPRATVTVEETSLSNILKALINKIKRIIKIKLS